MFNFHKNLRSLSLTAALGFLSLSILIAIVPAQQLQKVEALPNQQALGEQEIRGLKLYVSEGCVACHSQQVRNIEMDKVWGKRPSLPSDYYFSKQRLDVWRQSPSLLGSERTGPDLTDIGNRQPGEQWHLLHLYNPRTVVKASIMPGYSWMFEEKEEDEIEAGDKIIPLGKEFFHKPGKKVIASQEALDLLAYLLSLKQSEIGGEPMLDFIPAKEKTLAEGRGISPESNPNKTLDGETLFMNTCAACHQADGKGIVGAFPPLAGSKLINSEDPEQLIRIILQGYDARAEYGQMPGFSLQLKDEEVAAIATHERNSWGNKASEISTEEVARIREMIEKENSEKLQD